MSSEEMRVELEAFVNAGLREGWRGWPLKEESSVSRTSLALLRAGSARFWCRRDDTRVVPDRSLEVLRIGHRCCIEN